MNSTTTGSDAVMSCHICGASIYREHIDRGLAGRWAGQVLCPHCLAEKRGPAAGEPDHAAKTDENDAGTHPGRSSTYAGFAGLTDLDSMPYQRPLQPGPHGASRMRIYHCKLSEGPLMQLNRQVNEWLDAHPDIEVKFATSTIGTWEGRHAEQHIILTLYY
jgi:hypothetical protein